MPFTFLFDFRLSRQRRFLEYTAFILHQKQKTAKKLDEEDFTIYLYMQNKKMEVENIREGGVEVALL